MILAGGLSWNFTHASHYFVSLNGTVALWGPTLSFCIKRKEWKAVVALTNLPAVDRLDVFALNGDIEFVSFRFYSQSKAVLCKRVEAVQARCLHSAN